MLSISDFSEMCGLSPQTMRYYHSEGLLVPAEVDERTGYRSYAFSQVEQAMLISVLRAAGMSVKRVRRILDQPETGPSLLHAHRAEMQRERDGQDEALGSAEALLASPVEVQRRQLPPMTVVSAPVADVRATQSRWDGDVAAAVATVDEVSNRVTRCGGVITGSPWRILEAGAEKSESGLSGGQGPRWTVKVPIDAASMDALPKDLAVQEVAATEELFVFIPGKGSAATYATAMSRLLAHPLDSAYVDVGRVRHVLHEDGVETAAALRALAV